jgi:hypothetical protein
MGKYLLIGVAIWAVALGAGGRAWAVDEVHEGKVVAVGPETITVLDQRDDDTDVFLVTSATKITRDGKPAKLADIRVGDKARVTAGPSATSGDKLAAKEIVITTPR